MPSSSSAGKGWVCHQRLAVRRAGPRQLVGNRRPVIPRARRRWKKKAQPGWSVRWRPTGQVGDDGDAERAQQGRRADAGALQDRRRVVDAGRDDRPGRPRRVGRLAAAIADAGRAAVLDEDAIDQAAAADRQVRPRRAPRGDR